MQNVAENTAEFSKNFGKNEHAIKLEKGKQLLFRLISNIGLLKFKMLKTYIIINLANGFIYFFKLPARAFIFFNQKLDGSFCLFVNYWGLNNLTIKKNLLVLIGELLDQFNWTKRFI